MVAPPVNLPPPPLRRNYVAAAFAVAREIHDEAEKEEERRIATLIDIMETRAQAKRVEFAENTARLISETFRAALQSTRPLEMVEAGKLALPFQALTTIRHRLRDAIHIVNPILQRTDHVSIAHVGENELWLRLVAAT